MMRNVLQVFWVAFVLGLTSFGGPTAHLGYFHTEYVRKRNWLTEQEFVSLVALSQFLPGPSSSQVGMGIGYKRAGYLGSVAAWLGFTLPSAILLTLFALYVDSFGGKAHGFIHGLKLVAVVIVALAILQMGKSFIAKRPMVLIALGAALLSLLWQSVWSQIIIILASAGIALVFLRKSEERDSARDSIAIPWSSGVLLLLFVAFLFCLQFLHVGWSNLYLDMASFFYRTGSLVFGGGHVVLPLLQHEVLSTGLLTKSEFLSGYGLTQAMPGPLFTFAAYIGGIVKGVPGAIVAVLAIFLPAWLLLLGVLPIWEQLRTNWTIRVAMVGIQAAVVGLLVSTWIHPIVTSTILTITDIAICLLLLLFMQKWRVPVWAIVLIGGCFGWLFY